MEEGDKRQDSNVVSPQIRVGIGGGPAQAETIIAEMRRFIRSANKVGRAEIDIKGDTSLVMNKPKRFRYDIIDAIAKDSKRLMDAMALDCKVGDRRPQPPRRMGARFSGGTAAVHPL